MELNSKLKHIIKIGAQINVNLLNEENLVLMILISSAKNVIQYSKEINMQNSDSVLENAEVVGVRIKSIKLSGIEDVYCMVVSKNRNMIANGIIVSNCDALRYCLFTAFGAKKNLKWNEGGHDGTTLGGGRRF